MTREEVHRPDGSARPLFAYVRPVPGAEPPLDEGVQRTAVRACARGERLGVPEIFEEGAPDGRTAFGHLARLVDEAGGADAVVATLRVLGESALERARRLLLLDRKSVV